MGTPQFLILFVALMLASATYSITNNESHVSKRNLRFMYLSLATNECMSAQNTWDNAIQTMVAGGNWITLYTFTTFRYENVIKMVVGHQTLNSRKSKFKQR